MAFVDRSKDFKSGPNPSVAQTQPAAARQVTTVPACHLFSEKNKKPMQHSMMPFLDNEALVSLTKVSRYAKPFTLEERDQRGARKLIDLALRGEVSDLHLMKSPTENTPYQVSDERHLYLYQENDCRVFYCYEGGQGQQNPQQKHYLHDEKKQPLNLFFSTPDDPQYYTEVAFRQLVFDITTKRKHTRRSDSEEIKRIVDANPRLPCVVYRPKTEKDKTTRNRGDQLISLVDKMPLQVSYGDNNNYATDSTLKCSSYSVTLAVIKR